MLWYHTYAVSLCLSAIRWIYVLHSCKDAYLQVILKHFKLCGRRMASNLWLSYWKTFGTTLGWCGESRIERTKKVWGGVGVGTKTTTLMFISSIMVPFVVDPLGLHPPPPHASIFCFYVSHKNISKSKTGQNKPTQVQVPHMCGYIYVNHQIWDCLGSPRRAHILNYYMLELWGKG